MTYAIRISPAAEAAILAQARYIAIDQQAPLNAVRWLQSMFDAADGLDEYPRRYPLAAENDRRSYEIRQLNVAGHILLFTILEETQTVWVIGYRHGRMISCADDLPGTLPDESE